MRGLPPRLVLVAGLLIVMPGAELLLTGTTRIATLLRIRPVVIGLTVVTIGASLPELAMGITAPT